MRPAGREAADRRPGQPNTAVYVTIEGRNVREHKVLRSQDSTVSFEVPITAQDEPGITVNAAFVRDGVFHNGSKFVKVPPVQHQMNVSVKSDKPQYLPGQTAEYSIEATSIDGKPVPGAEFSLGVVDEAIYGIRPDIDSGNSGFLLRSRLQPRFHG